MEKSKTDILLGYVIMRNYKFKTRDCNTTEWSTCESGYHLDHVKKKLYQWKPSAEDAVEQLKKHRPEDEYEIHPVYWYGRNKS